MRVGNGDLRMVPSYEEDFTVLGSSRGTFPSSLLECKMYLYIIGLFPNFKNLKKLEKDINIEEIIVLLNFVKR